MRYEPWSSKFLNPVLVISTDRDAFTNSFIIHFTISSIKF